MAIHFEQTILGASLYCDNEFICGVSGIEDAERLKNLIGLKDSRILGLEGVLRELIDAVKSMDMRKQKEVLYLCDRVLNS